MECTCTQHVYVYVLMYAIYIYSIAGKMADLYFGNWRINYEIVKIDSAILLYSEPAQ